MKTAIKCQIGSKRSALNIHKRLSRNDNYLIKPMTSLSRLVFLRFAAMGEGGLLGQCYQSVSVEMGQKIDWRVVCTIKP